MGDPFYSIRTIFNQFRKLGSPTLVVNLTAFNFIQVEERRVSSLVPLSNKVI